MGNGLGNYAEYWAAFEAHPYLQVRRIDQIWSCVQLWQACCAVVCNARACACASGHAAVHHGRHKLRSRAP